MLSEPAIRAGINVMVTVSTAKVVRQIIRNNVDTPETLNDKLKLIVGSFAIGGLVASKVVERTEQSIDHLMAVYRGVTVTPEEHAKSE